MLIEKHSFEGGCNGDINARELPTNSMLNCMNARMAVTEYGRTLRIENLPGTTLINQAVYPPYGVHQCLGSVPDLNGDNRRLIYALWNSFGDHGIYCYDLLADTTYAVLYDSQVTGGLNFSKDYRFDRNMKVVGGKLYMVDGDNNQPREINIDAAIKANLSSYVTDEVPYSLPIDFTELTIIKKPPPLSPNIQKLEDVTFENNFIANDSFEFVFMYDYYTNERTVVGTYSPASRLNKSSDTENYIQVTMDELEQIPGTVKTVSLVARFQDGSWGGGIIAKIIKTWDKSIQSERNEIIEHNNGTQVLTFDFYNNVQGETIPPENVLKPYDSVPIFSETLETAKNRNFLGNNTEGYNTPTSTSLSLSQTTVNIGGTVLNKNLIGVSLSWIFPLRGYSAYYVYLTEVLPVGYYELTSTVQTNSSPVPPTLPAAPPSIAFSGLTFRGATQSDVISYVRGTLGNPVSQFTNTWNFTSSVLQITGISVNTYDVFKSRSQYKVGVVFYDFAMRKCGVVTTDNLIFEIPERDFAYSSGVNGVIWTLDNTNALTEIPDWAYYYCVVRTLNQLTRFFIDSFTNAAKYATKNSDGQYQYTSNLFVTGSIGIALNTTALFQSGLGYSFSEGDIAVLTLDDDSVYEFPVIAQDSNYIIVKAGNLGDLSNRRIQYEIYTPYKSSEQEPFYEVGQMYRILNPGESTRVYETLSDIFAPDAYVLTRNYGTNTYFAEAMCPNDLFYQRWDNDGGKPNYITNLGQVKKTQFFRFSNTYIPNTATNGLSTFEALNQRSVPEGNGVIQKLALTTKVQNEGTVMLAICTNETSPIYLGETQVSDASGATKFFAQSTGVVGTINVLKGSVGTINPESVISYLGLVFWYDTLNGYFVQYSVNGLEPISRYGMGRFFKNYALDYNDASTGNLDNINGFHHIPTFIDPFHRELGVTLPGLIYENYAATLPSYSSVPSYATSIINRFDIYDQLAKSMSFQFEENKWGQNYNYGAEWYDYIENIMFGWKDGYLYTHNTNTTNWNTFYGTEYPVRLCFTCNTNQSLLKLLNDISIEGNAYPEFTVGYADYPNIQITDLQGSDYVNQEGNFYSTFFKDRLSPNSSGTADEKLYTGDDVTDIAIKIMLEFPAYSNLIYINFVNIGFSASRGQKLIANPVNKP